MKSLLLFAAISFACFESSSAQIICILCYDQNDSISSGVTNLITNGSLETNNCTPNTNGSSYCPNSINYNCTITGWTCTGGGQNTYASMWTNALTVVPDGLEAAYFGNDFCLACSGQTGDTSCFQNIDCVVQGIPPAYPINSVYYGGTNGISLSQTVSGLTVGATYVLEFWCGGEDFGSFTEWGVFGVDVGFGDTLLRTRATNPGKVGKRYIVEFNATSTSHTIKFTNWGHVCSNCTELILDNVRLYTLAQLDPSVPACVNISSVPNFASSDSTVCQKFCLSFYDSSTNNPTAWLWQFPGGNPSSSTDQNPASICYNDPGTYDVTLITSNSSGSDTLTKTNFVTVYQTPAFPLITQTGYTLTSSLASSYQWQYNTTDIPGATNQSYDVLQTGYYTVVIGSENGCSNSATTYVLIVGVDNIDDGNISVYPNPSTGNFVLELNSSLSGEVSIDVVNAIGQSVYSSQENISIPKWKKELDLGNEAAGVYFIEIKSKDFSSRKKIIISK